YDTLNRYDIMRANREITDGLSFAYQLDPIVTTSDNIGRSVALSADGSVAAVASLSSGFASGRVYIYRRVATLTGSTWNLVQTLFIDNAFGANPPATVAISADGTVIAVGAPGYNTAPGKGALLIYRFNSITGLWSLEQLIASPHISISSTF